jgi:hypothetical protein
MMAAWMAYALAMSLLIGIAALLAERLARIAKLQTRVAWIAALMLSLLLPLSLAWKDARTSPQRARIELVALASERARAVSRNQGRLRHSRNGRQRRDRQASAGQLAVAGARLDVALGC